MNPPIASRVVVQTSANGFTLVLPALGFHGYWRSWLCCLGLFAALIAFGIVAIQQLFLTESWLSGFAWLAGLAVAAILLRPLVVWFSELIERSLAGGAILVAGQQLFLSQGGAWRARRKTWDASGITALDEDEGVLCVLSEGKLEGFFAGRKRAELRWVATVLRQALAVAADPPALKGEVAVCYRLPNEEDVHRGFVCIAPGRFRLRPRFQLDAGLALRLDDTGQGAWLGVALDSLVAGSLAIQPEDVSWGIGVGGQAVLRIRLHDPAGVDPIPLELSGERLHELRSAFETFWQHPYPEATG